MTIPKLFRYIDGPTPAGQIGPTGVLLNRAGWSILHSTSTSGCIRDKRKKLPDDLLGKRFEKRTTEPGTKHRSSIILSQKPTARKWYI